MQASIETDTAAYRAQVQKLATITGRSLQSVMRESVGIMAGQLARRFPPNSKSTGQKAIKAGLHKIAIPFDDIKFLRQAARNTNDPRFDPNGEKLRDWHEKRRTRSRRRTRAITTQSFVSGLGGKWSDKLYVGKTAFNKYARERGQAVGTLKARWLSPLIAFGGGKMPASWVAGKMDKGEYQDRMKANGDGYIEFVNTSKGIGGDGKMISINSFVLKSQNRMMARRIRGEIKKAAREAGS